MNSLGAIAIVYFLMTLGSASILYYSFKNNFDISSRYFLLAEILMLLTLAQIILTNIYISQIHTIFLFLGNWFALCSELALFLSIYGLTREIKKYFFIIGVLGIAIYCILIESARYFIDTSLPIVLFSGLSLILAIATFQACRSHKEISLRENQFLSWIGYLEFGLALFSLIRIVSYFLGEYIVPRTPTDTNIILFALMITLSIFRYISYQSLRITWIDSKTNGTNYLNVNLSAIVQEKNKLLQNLISSNRALGISALASSLAHQLSQPLTGITIHAETVKRSLLKKENSNQEVTILNKISDELYKLSDLVNNLRGLFVRQDENFKVIALKKIIDDVLEIIEPTLQTHKINLLKSYQKNPLILGNSIQIQQVIINIMNNAIESIIASRPVEKVIKLNVFDDENKSVITISDSGLGIAPENFDGLFELYKSSKPGGLGVGLWLSKTIIERHQGSLKADNIAMSGARFMIEFPKVNSSLERAIT